MMYFGRDKEKRDAALENLRRKNSSQSTSQKLIDIFTIDNLPGRSFEALGMVRSETTKFGGGGFNSIIKEIREKALELGADAVIGYRETGIGGAAAGAFSLLSVSGTAIRFTDSKEDLK